MLQIKLVIFDCDGVLINSEPLASRTLAEALNRVGVAITPAEAHRRFTGNAEPEIRRICETDYGLADVSGLFARWHEDLYATFATDLLPMDGMLELVAGLNLPKCVASNSSAERLGKSLGNTNLAPLFASHVYSAQAVANPKPAPDLLIHCATQFSIRPDQCVMIDDSPHGVRAAVAAGMIPIGFVDPVDPRLDRVKTLMRAGAEAVATGSDELRLVLEQVLDPGKGPRELTKMRTLDDQVQ
jgi:HAD superfamily hydrolase (TIGR01509 family)